MSSSSDSPIEFRSDPLATARVMAAPDDKLDYASPDIKPPEPTVGRPLRVWVQLLLIWAVGLIVWAAYLIALGYLILRIV